MATEGDRRPAVVRRGRSASVLERAYVDGPSAGEVCGSEGVGFMVGGRHGDAPGNPPVGCAGGERVRILANGGLTFNGDTAAANALDDYEEGTWTMGITFGGAAVGVTTSNNTGTYTKIGRQVTVNGVLILTSKGSSTGVALITGLPFTVGNANGYYPSVTLRMENVTFANQFQAYGGIGSTVIALDEITEAGVNTELNNNDFANNSTVMVNLTYFV